MYNIYIGFDNMPSQRNRIHSFNAIFLAINYLNYLILSQYKIILKTHALLCLFYSSITIVSQFSILTTTQIL